MQFGEVDQYILFGGGQILLLIAADLAQDGASVLVATSERHCAETMITDSGSRSFLDCLKSQGLEYLVSTNVSTDPAVTGKITKNAVGISFSAPWIFTRKFIDLFQGRLINLHSTRLPQDRGGGGFSWRIMRGDRTGMSLIHQVDPGLDTGNIVLCQEHVFPPDCRLPADYEEHSMRRDHDLFRRLFAMIKERKSVPTLVQQECFSSYWPRLHTDIHGFIDWRWSLADLEGFICAFDDPYAGASTFMNGSKVRLKKCCTSYTDGVFHPFQTGIVFRANPEAIFVAAQQGTLIIGSVLDESGADVKGKINVGDRFWTPNEALDEARQFRAVYNAAGLKKSSES